MKYSDNDRQKWLIRTFFDDTPRNKCRNTTCLSMYLTSTIAIVAICVALLIAPNRLQAAENSYMSCELYRKISTECKCHSSDGYLNAYGYKYCEKFRLSTGWTPKGQDWRNATLMCLQQKLKIAVRLNKCNCEAIGEDAFKSHATCYTQPVASFCDLSDIDKSKIVNEMIDGSDLYSLNGVRQAIEIAWICLTNKISRSIDN